MNESELTEIEKKYLDYWITYKEERPTRVQNICLGITFEGENK